MEVEGGGPGEGMRGGGGDSLGYLRIFIFFSSSYLIHPSSHLGGYSYPLLTLK